MGPGSHAMRDGRDDGVPTADVIPDECSHSIRDRHRPGFYQLEHAHRHAACPGVDAADGASCTAAEIKTATAHKRPAIIDAHSHGAVVGKVGDTHLGTKRQRFVRGCQTIGIERFTVGGGVAALIPAGDRHGVVGETGCRQTDNGEQAQKGREERPIHEGGTLIVCARRLRGSGRCMGGCHLPLDTLPKSDDALNSGAAQVATKCGIRMATAGRET